MSFDGNSYYPGNTNVSPVHQAPPEPGLLLESYDDGWWEVDFNNGLQDGSYYAKLFFEFPNWGTCHVVASTVVGDE
jgi:hypothetical protein